MCEILLMFVLVYKYSEFFFLFFFCCKYPIGKKQSPYILSRLIFGLTLRCVCVCIYIKRRDRLWDPPSFLLIVYRGPLPEVNWPECDVNHSPSSSAEVKDAVPMCLHGVDRKNLTCK